MNDTMVMGFIDELEKISSVFKDPKADLVGLGLLGIPVVHKLTDKKSTKTEKGMAALEGAGLGTLAAHTIANMGKHGSKKLKISAPISPAHMKMMQQHMRSDAHKAMGGAAGSTPAPALRGQSRTFEPHELGGGGHSAPLELARPVKAAPKVMPAARPVASAGQAARAGGVMGRIGKFFKGV